jgi:hypothetical protein
MAFEDSFNELEQMLRAKSTDYEKMRETLQKMLKVQELARMLGPAQDNLYASIAHHIARRLLILRPATLKPPSERWLVPYLGLSGALGVSTRSRYQIRRRWSRS